MAKKVSILLVAALVLTGITFTLFLFKIKHIILNPQNCLSSDHLNVKSKIIFTVSTKVLVQQLKQKYDCISEIKISKIYPSKLKIEVTTKNQVVKIAESNLSITEAGEVIEAKEQNLPILYAPRIASLTSGQKVFDKNLIVTVKIAGLLSKTDFHLATVRFVNSNEIAVYDREQTIAIFTTEKDAAVQVDSLQQVVANAKIEGDKIVKIDLRFDKPVITFR